MNTGIGFGTPVIADGKVVVPYDKNVVVYGILP